MWCHKRAPQPTCPSLHHHRPLMSPLPPPLPATSCHHVCVGNSVRWQTRAQCLAADVDSAAKLLQGVVQSLRTASAAASVTPLRYEHRWHV